jgi:hypothetical protein
MRNYERFCASLRQKTKPIILISVPLPGIWEGKKMKNLIVFD